MATDELTAEIIGEFQDALAGVIETDKGWSSTLEDVLSTHARLTAALRADRDRLREERDRLLGEAIKRTADRHDDVAGRTRANASEAIENLVRQVAQLRREEIAAKDAEIQRLKDAATKYPELIYAVGKKYPGETRHETALRYIRRAEEPDGIASSAAPMEDWRGANEDWRKR